MASSGLLLIPGKGTHAPCWAACRSFGSRLMWGVMTDPTTNPTPFLGLCLSTRGPQTTAYSLLLTPELRMGLRHF